MILKVNRPTASFCSASNFSSCPVSPHPFPGSSSVNHLDSPHSHLLPQPLLLPPVHQTKWHCSGTPAPLLLLALSFYLSSTRHSVTVASSPPSWRRTGVNRHDSCFHKVTYKHRHCIQQQFLQQRCCFGDGCDGVTFFATWFYWIK